MVTTTAKDNILYGGDQPPGVTTDCRCLGEFIVKQLKEIGDKKVLIQAATEEEFSGNDLFEMVSRLVTCLRSLGIKEGDSVALCSENSIEFVAIALAVICCNATLAPLNVTYTERELLHAINLSRPKFFFTSTSCANLVTKVSMNAPFVKEVFVIAKESSVPGIRTYYDLILDPKIKNPSSLSVESTDVAENVSLIMCSSGTTGLPKGVQLTQRNILSSLDSQFQTKGLLEEATLLSVIPWFHAYGCMTMILMCLLGIKSVFLPRFEERAFLKSIEKYRVNMCFLVPPLMVFLAKSPLVDEYNLNSLVMLFSGAAPLSKETEEAVKKRVGVLLIRQGYGLTETTLSVLVMSDDTAKPGSVGGLKPGMYAKIVDTETGKLLGPNQPGELCFKGDVIMKGYVGDTAATSSMIDKDGWLHTGDIGYYDEDFVFFIVDRIKELIKYKAFQVPPAEIESVLLTHPDIQDAAVVGLPDEECGELPLGFVVKKPGTKLTEVDVVTYVANRMSSAKRLRGGVRFVDSIPKNPSGKILRRVLRDMIKKLPNSKL